MPSRTEGTLTGAASGAAAGSVLGPWGAAAGGVIGGALGYFGSGGGPSQQELEHRMEIRRRINQGLDATANRAAPQAMGGQSIVADRVGGVPIDRTQQEQFRVGELAQAQRLQRIASGTERGAGEMAVGRSVSAAQAGQAAQARIARGSAAPQAGLAAARGMQEIGVTGAGLAGEAALRDRSQAEANLTGVLGQGRGADIGLATSQAGLTQQGDIANQQARLQAATSNAQLSQNIQLANLQARLQQTGMNDAAQLAYLAQLTGMDSTELQARIAAAGRNSQIMGGVIDASGQVIARNLGGG